MKFSIIIPVYNAAAFVGDTIENLLLQEVGKEIILINDGSTDNSIEILRTYESNHDCIRVIDKENGGVSSARNAGLDAATGDYVIFVDSDDFIDKDTLSRCENFLSQDNLDAVFFTYKYCYLDGRKEVPHYYKPTGAYETANWLEDFYTLFSLHIIHCIGTTIYKRDIIEKIGLRFKSDISYNEDIGFCATYLGFTNNLFYINEPLYHYRIINSTSLISKYKKDFSFANDYRYEVITQMLHRIFSKKSLPYQDMYRALGDDILMCLENILNRDDVPHEQIRSELEHLSKLTYLQECITYTGNNKNRKKLRALKLKTIDEMERVISDIYKKEHQWQKYVISPLRKLYHLIKR